MNRRIIVALLAAVLAVSLAAPASAKTETKTATLTYAGIKVSLNGRTINPADVKGNYIEPFIIDGTVYLPLRGIASALGLNVGWEQASHTVKLTSGGTVGSEAKFAQPTYGTQTVTLQYANIFIKLDGKDVWPHDANGNYVEPFIIDGSVYLPVRGIASALGMEVSWDKSTHTVKLEGRNLIPDQLDISILWDTTISEERFYPEYQPREGLSLAFFSNYELYGEYYVEETGCVIPFKGTYSCKGNQLTLTYLWDDAGEGIATTEVSTYLVQISGQTMILTQTSDNGLLDNNKRGTILQLTAGSSWFISASELKKNVLEMWGFGPQ